MGEQSRPLSDLGLTARNGRNPVLTGLTADSRLVQPGTMFVALPGLATHGATFAKQAIENGARAILTDAKGADIVMPDLEDAALIVADDPREALAHSAALWFGAQPETIVAVTGTNGKTSVAHFVRQIWTQLGLQAVNLGTTGVEGAWSAPLTHTTPEPTTLHRTLAEARKNGITHVAMEASSHGLDQRRLDGVTLAAAGFTNLTQDHLDYHKTFDAYFEAKAGLFSRVLSPEGAAVINMDDPYGLKMSYAASTRVGQVISVSRQSADLSLTAQRFDATGQDIRFNYLGIAHASRLELIGGFQAENVMLACGLAIASGSDPDAVFATLPQLHTVRGRMQHAATRENGAAIFVDYAHTPDAISTALQAMRSHVLGRLIAVIGAGGDRDTGKRPLMGAAAAQHADTVYVTDDNPRSEDPADIRAAVLQGCPDAIEIADRAEAIVRAVDALEPGDCLLITGKGHETGQIVGDDVFPFDDVEQASVAVAALEGRGL